MGLLLLILATARGETLEDAVANLRFGLELLDPASRDGEVVLGVRTQAERVSDLAEGCDCLEGEVAKRIVELVDSYPGALGREGTTRLIEVGAALPPG